MSRKSLKKETVKGILNSHEMIEKRGIIKKRKLENIKRGKEVKGGRVPNWKWPASR